MKFTIYQESRTGRRRTNQDRIAYCYSRDALIMVIADGMGGHLHGEIAAQIAVECITRIFQREARPIVQDGTLFLSRALTNAHHAILDYAFDKSFGEAPRTTVVACLVQDGTAQWAHAGDSRLYVLRRGRMVAQTRDHSRVQLMLDQGLLDEQGAAQHPGRNRVYSCLGGSHPPQIEFSRHMPLHHKDTLILCTDGVWSPLGEKGLVEGFAGRDVIGAVPPLLDEAERRAGSTCDNLSMIAMTWHDDLAQEEADAISTQGMAADVFTTQMEHLGTGKRRADSLSDDEIENAIAEINAAIQKFSKQDE